MAKPFEAEQQSLEELMGNKDKLAYAIPLYQRRYVWREEQNSKLWEDVYECYTKKNNHFLGSLVLMPYEKDEYGQKSQADELDGNGYTVCHIVDGQQRLTSLSLILAALYADMLSLDGFMLKLPDLDSQLKQDWDSLKSDIRTCLVTKVRDWHSDSGKGYIPRVVPVQSVYEAYKAIMNQEGVKKKLLVEKAYQLHATNIRELRESELPSTRDDLLNHPADPAYEVFQFFNQLYISIATRMKFVRIDCSADEDAFQVFESLNGTGLSLTSADRIKNILMGRGAKEKNPITVSKIESRWQELETLVGGARFMEPFFSAYMFVKKEERVSRRKLPLVFRDDYLDKIQGGVNGALADLKRAAKCYGLLTGVSQTFEDTSGNSKQLSSSLRETLAGIMKNNPNQSLVPLLAAAVEYGFANPNFELVAKALLVLLVRHKVCQKSANALDKFFGKTCHMIEFETVTDVLNILSQNMQSDASFSTHFADMTFDPDSGSDTSRARYYLEMIENYLRKLHGNDALDVNQEYTLEHIIPRSFDSDDWFANYPTQRGSFDSDSAAYQEQFKTTTIWSIGNMCLLRPKENSTASNKDYDSKLQAYQVPDLEGKTAKDTFSLVGQIVDNSMESGAGAIWIVEEGRTFDAESVERRSKVLAEYALKIWKR